MASSTIMIETTYLWWQFNSRVFVNSWFTLWAESH
jgi:hypothetical protein